MKLLQGISLRYRIAAGVILGLAVLLSVFGYLAVRAIGQTKDVALEERLRLAETTAGSVDALVEHTILQLEAAASIDVVREEGCASDEVQTLYHILGTFGEISCLDSAGQVQWAVPGGLENFDGELLDQADFAEALRSSESSILQKPVPDGEHPPVGFVLTPILDDAGASLGFLLGELHLSHLGLSLVALPEQQESVKAELVDRNGHIIARGDDTDITEADEHAPVLRDFIAEGVSGTRIHQNHVVAYYPLTSLAGGVVIEQQEDQALAVPRDLQRTALIFGIGAVIVASAAAWFHAGGVVKPIRDLTRASGRIAAGALGDPIIVTRDDEVGTLARSFDTMRQRLKESRERQQKWEKELEERVRQRTVELERRNREQAALNRIAATVSRSLDLETIMTASLDELLEIMSADAGGMFLASVEGVAARTVQRGLPDDGQQRCLSPQTRDCLCGQALGNAEAILVEDLNRYQGWIPAACRVRGFASLAIVPVQAKGEPLGVLLAASVQSDHLGQADLELLKAIGNTVGVAVENASLHEELREKEAVRSQLLRQAISAQEEERKRIARELHDESAQVLATLLVEIGAAENLLAPTDQAAQGILSRAKADATRALTEMRQMILDLRPSALDDLGLVAAVQWYAKTRLEADGVRVNLKIDGSQRRLPATVETALFRIAQEALNNVLKHANARSANIFLRFADSSVAITVEDDGQGFDVSSLAARKDLSQGLGLLGMRERAALLGGKASIESQPGRGSRVSVEIPLEGHDGAG